MTIPARLCLAVCTVIALALGGVAAFTPDSARAAAVHVTPAALATPSCPAATSPAQSAGDALLAPGPTDNNSCPGHKTCCAWADPDHHICTKCC